MSVVGHLRHSSSLEQEAQIVNKRSPPWFGERLRFTVGSFDAVGFPKTDAHCQGCESTPEITRILHMKRLEAKLAWLM